MKGRGHRKQILLFLIAVMLPSLILIFLTIHMIGQENELAQKRMVEERLRIANEIGQHLLVRLENIKLQETAAAANWDLLPTEINYSNPEVVLLCPVEDRQLILPWEKNRELENNKQLLNQSKFTQKIYRGERAEFVEKNLSRAANLYNQALNSTKEPVQKGYAQLLLARSLFKSNRKKEAISNYRKISRLPYSVTDEYGFPFSLYAAGRLVEIGESSGDVLNSIQEKLNDNYWLAPGAAYLIQNLLERMPGSASDVLVQKTLEGCTQYVQNYVQKMDQALALQNDYLSLGLVANQGSRTEKTQPQWVYYGKQPWLVSLSASLPDRPPYLVAVNAHKILVSLRSDDGFVATFPADFHFVSSNDLVGLSLGPNFKEVKIAFDTDQEELFPKLWRIQPIYYLLALFLILGITLFGAYILWRDVRREVQLAEMRSQFVSSVSHELKTPLTAIRMFAETLRLGRSKDKKTQEEYLDTIVNESQRLTRLLNNVLDFSKIEQGKRTYRPEGASLYEIIQSAARAMEYPLSQQGFKLNIQIDKGLPEVQVDHDAIEQALLNLLHNAMKYSGNSREIELRLRKENRDALIQVMDGGIGIDPQEKNKIFEKFYRIPSPENERIVGTGLGLALVSHIVKEHGGHIEVESAPGKGSTFSIYLPLEDES
jgi:signal transduction histidine kinase